ncbi:IS630 family transposase [Streptomyces virginiae]|uniref:IS630 family transposase n=1 Tax=Streptomyces virginiae TaxID=1961 RepID=UPI0036D0B027
MSYRPSSVVSGWSVPPLSRPQSAEARRVRAVELFGQGRSNAEIAGAVGVHAESVRRWRRAWEIRGAQSLRRRPAPGRRPKLNGAQVEEVRAALERDAQAHGFEADPWTLERVGLVVERVTGMALSRASVRRPLTGRLGWSPQRPERRAVQRDGSEIARWIAHEWPRIKKGAVNTRAWIVFLDESGVSLLPRIRRTYSPRGRTPLLRHRLNRKRASMAGALGHHSTDPERGARLCFHLKPGSHDTTALIEVLEQMKVFYRGERVVLVRDGLSAHRSRAMRAWVADQDRLTLERLPAYAPELNPVEPLWSSLKKRELANLAGDHLADVADATAQGIHRINQNPQLPWSFLTHTGLTIHPPHPQNLRKDQ